jgi:nicotinamide-nucleotide amidase
MDGVTPFEPLVIELGRRLRARGAMLGVAESCTGGLLAAACTSVAGSSDWFERGVVTYSNAAKQELLGVPPATLAAHGAVSEPTARAMAEGLLRAAPVHWAASVTGIAGPGGGSADKPVGLVWIAWGGPAGVRTERLLLAGDRAAIRAQSVGTVLQRLVDALA